MSVPPLPRLLAHPHSERLFVRFSRDLVAQGCRDVLEELRRALDERRPLDPAALEEETILARVEARLGGLSETALQRVVNATGTVLHADLGRALLPRIAVQAVTMAATQPLNLDYDLAQGDAGRREQAVSDLLVEITGAEAATIVNNNTGALLLALHALARGREIIVSRRDLEACGAALRLRDVADAAGASLRVVGDAAGACASEYEAAIDSHTALLLALHTGGSAGETDEGDARIRELVTIGRRRGVPVVEIAENGALTPLSRYGVSGAPAVADRVALGLDLVTFSGDKAAGGPQAGLMVGRAVVVQRLMRSPLHRALRCGKLTIAALEGTLRLYREAADIVHEIPALRALARPLDEIEDTARRALPALASALGVGFRVFLHDTVSRVSSEAGPAGGIPTKAIAIEHDYMGAHRIAGRFRQARPPIIGRVENDYFLLDARTIFDPLDLVPNWTDELEEPARYPL